MTKTHAVSFRYDDNEAKAITTIMGYIEEQCEQLPVDIIPTASWAIRYAIETTATRIRQERKEQEASDVRKNV